MRRLLRAVAVLAVLAIAGAAAAAWWAHGRLYRPHGPAAGEHVDVTVPRGASAGEILTTLERRGVLADARLARAYLVWRLDDAPLKAGEYRFEGPQTAIEVLAKLIQGSVRTHAVTILEGLTLAETAALVAGEGHADLEGLLAEMADPSRIADLDPDAADLEGYLFPDTYRFAAGTAPAQIVDALVATFRERLAAVRAGLPADVPEPATRELVTLASIVEKEALLDAERPLVAGVYANRLRIGMPLQADPTVIYALKRVGRWDGNLRRDDLRRELPYNTYRYPGLPPGPICSPGLASLAAAAAPADVPHLYFVSRNDGSHAFAETLAEHNRNVQRWQRDYWRRRWAEERRSDR